MTPPITTIIQSHPRNFFISILRFGSEMQPAVAAAARIRRGTVDHCISGRGAQSAAAPHSPIASINYA
jgi:hypothetical protein